MQIGICRFVYLFIWLNMQIGLCRSAYWHVLFQHHVTLSQRGS